MSTCLYNLPQNIATNGYYKVFEIFNTIGLYQNWRFFGNNLSKTSSLIQYKCDNKKEWQIFGSGSLKKHYSNRFSRKGKNYYFHKFIRSKIIEKINSSLLLDNETIIYNDLFFNFLAKIISKNCKFNFKIRLVNVIQPEPYQAHLKKYITIPIFESNLILEHNE